MTRVLFVTNGHGEIAIGARIARELGSLDPRIACDHLALVGNPAASPEWNEVGPRRAMPSGGLIAMLHLRNIVRDLGSGLLGLTLAQRAFLRASHDRYAAVVAVGDVFALLMSKAAHRPLVFVGTAKSVRVAPYGPFERRAIAGADAAFVRDEATADDLRKRGVAASAPGNVIVDLFSERDDAMLDALVGDADPFLVLLPGSRNDAYAQALHQCRVLRDVARTRQRLRAAISIAPTLATHAFVAQLRDGGCDVRERDDARSPFTVRMHDRDVLFAWRDRLGPLFARATLVLGQAGTANEGAAACGAPVVALELTGRGDDWYRRRQRGLLGEAMIVARGESTQAASIVGALLDDAQRRAMMGAAGRERMGPPGGARAIAARIAQLAQAAS